MSTINQNTIKLTDKLLAAGWTKEDVIRAAHSVKAVFIRGSILISPDRYIEDKSEASSLQLRLTDLLPVGSSVTADGTTLLVRNRPTGIELVDGDGKQVMYISVLGFADLVAFDVSVKS